MSWAFIIILAVLVFIAYQLVQLNRGKKLERALNVAEKNEEKVREFFPHLYPMASEAVKEEIRDFVAQSVKENMENDSSFAGHDNLAYYIYLGRYKTINDKIAVEADSKKKEQMQTVKEEISGELKKWDGQLDTMVEEGKISSWEKDFVLWNCLKAINEQFPNRYFKLNDYFKFPFDVKRLG